MMQSEDKIRADFNELKPNLSDWGQRVDEHLMQLVSCEFDVYSFVKIQPSFRLKSDQSYIDKALYRQKEYKNPLIDIEDKIGTRIVLLKSEDINLISERILNSNFWSSKVTKSQKGEIIDKPTIFDYQSQHIVVFPNSSDKYGPEQSNMLGCEIQIRTLLQHAFAEISHDSTYKGPFKNDKEIIRHLSKSMALMEATDDYFCKVFDMMGDEKRKYSNFLSELTRIYEGLGFKFNLNEFSFELNDSLISLLDKKDVSIQAIETFAQKHKSDLLSALSTKTNFIFSQPISLLISYYQFTSQDFLEEHWPLNLNAYRRFINTLGFTSGKY